MSDDLMSRSVTPTADALLQELPDGDAVLLHLGSERYFGLDAVGARMWAALITAPSVAEACEELLGEYDVEPATLEQDLQALVESLVERELLEISSE